MVDFCPIILLFSGQKEVMSVLKEIKTNILQGEKGKLLFISDFLHLGEYEAVRKSLQRLVQKHLIIRLSKGIYYYPKTDAMLGVLYPTAIELGKAIAKRDKARIIPAGAYALHMLGLSTQVPTNIVFLSDGSARKIRIGNQTVIFKKTNPKSLKSESELSNLIIQGLKAKGKGKITNNDIQRIKEIIKKSGEIDKLKNNIKNAPVWIQKIITQILKNLKNEKLA